jgi:hypothetical protein
MQPQSSLSGNNLVEAAAASSSPDVPVASGSSDDGESNESLEEKKAKYICIGYLN